MARANWSGTITMGVMSIPAKMYSAVDDQKTRFRQIHECGSRVSELKYCQNCGREVEKNEIKKGYPIGKDQYVVFEDGELEAIRLNSNSAIEIQEFIQPMTDGLYLGKPSYLAPNWESSRKRFTGLKSFSLFERALKETGLWALGKVVQRNRENLVVIRPFTQGILLLQQVRYTAEVKDHSEIKTDTAEVADKEVELAKSLIDQMRGDGDLSKYSDRYEEALAELIDKKASGEVIEAEPQVSQETEDLISQLTASLEQVKK